MNELIFLNQGFLNCLFHWTLHELPLICQLKNSHKLRVMFYLVRNFRTPAWGTESQVTERTALRRRGAESGYVEVGKKGQIVWPSKDYCNWRRPDIKRRNSVLFCVWGYSRLGSMKSVLSLAFPPSVPGTLCFSHPESPGCSHREGLQSGRCEITGVLRVPGARRLMKSCWRAGIADECGILVYRQGRKYPSSQSLPLDWVTDDMHHLIRIQCLGDISWPTESHGAGRLSPDQAQVPIDMSSQVFIFRLAPLMEKERSSGSYIFNPCSDPGDISLVAFSQT